MSEKRKSLFGDRPVSPPTQEALRERGTDPKGIVPPGGTMGRKRFSLKPRSKK